MGDSDCEGENAVLQQFTNKLLNEVCEEDNNYLISPLSVEIALAMVYQGAAGKTAEEMANILSVTGKKSAAAGYKKIIDKLNNLKCVTLDMANKIFIMENFSLKKKFKNVIEDSFMSRSDLVDFSKNQKTAKDINQWVESKTNNKIKDMISANSLNSSTRLVLVNALYFKGDWAKPFKVEDTNTEAFYVSDDETVECEMMFIFNDFKMRNNSDLNAMLVEFPYTGDKASMVIILPHDYDGIDELEKKMANVDLASLMVGAKSVDVEISLPKFKIEGSTDIKPLLEKMGLDEIFDPDTADFSEISEKSNGLHISEFMQKTYIDVNEKGTEAAAASQCGMMLCSGPQRVTVDHPFMFFLQTCGKKGNTVLFVGKVLRPTYTLPF